MIDNLKESNKNPLVRFGLWFCATNAITKNMISAWERQACLTVNASVLNLDFLEFYFSISMRMFSSCQLIFSRSSKLFRMFCSNVSNDVSKDSLL